jgi:trk system potassium uptake protein TrkH
VPFLLTGVTSAPHLALFESVSGFTTTGASIFPDVDGLPRSILLWRSASQWLGGMGIIVLGVAILPLVGVGGAQLFHAEASGITTDRLRPRIASTARRLWAVYALLTLVLALALWAAGMGVFDAVNHAMTALATGGFSTRTASLGAFSALIQWITIVGMLVGAVNFTLHYEVVRGHPGRMWRDPEFRAFGVLLLATLVVTVAIIPAARGWSAESVRGVVFSVASIATTTGYGTEDFAQWPAFGQVVLIGLMFIGGMAGSTAGGLKIVRVLVVLRHAAAEIRRVVHPRAVFVARIGRQALRDDVVARVLAYLALYMMTHAAGTLALTLTGADMITALSATVASMSSVGPGLGTVGPAGHYADLGAPAQMVLATVMLLGRLEFYTLLVLVLPETWNRAGGHR